VFTQLPPAPGLEGGGFGNAVQGTVVMVGIGILLAAPLGILSAIYICEYNRRSSLAGGVRFIAKLLTGVPSIICGCFCLCGGCAFHGVISRLLPAESPWLFLRCRPFLLTTEQAILGVPNSLREASYGMGATRFQTIFSGNSPRRRFPPS